MEAITAIKTIAAGVAAIVSVCPIHTIYEHITTSDEEFHKRVLQV